MLITFSCPAHASITMFGDVAVSLLKIMGHSGKIPSALSAEEIQAALLRLEAAIEQPQEQLPEQLDDEDENDEPPVSLSHRALPLIALLKAADKEKCNVMWDSNK